MEVVSAVFSRDGNSILTASEDNTAKLWVLSGKCLVTLSGRSAYVLSAVFSPDGKSILTASKDNTAKLWDLSGKCLVTFSGHSNYVNTAVFTQDGKSILTASGDKTAKLWDLTGKCLVTLSGHSSNISKAVFSPDGQSILTSSADKTAKLWDLSGKCLVTFSGHSDWVISAVFSPDGKSILSASGDKTAKLWDLSGKCLATFSGHSNYVYSAVFSPDGKSILTASHDNTAKLWDLSGKCLITFSGHSDWVNSAVFSLDGKSILTASFDKTAKLWDLSGKCLITLAGHSAGVYSAVFSADGKSILTVSFDETAKLWLTPSSITKWLNTAKIGSLSPADKAEIDELDDFYNIQLSDDISFITEYANWYLNKLDTTKAVILYERALQLNPMSVDKKLLGDIYRTQNETNKYFEYYKNEPEAIIKDSISSIVDTSTTNNYYGIYLYYLVRTRLYEQLLKVEPSEENKYKAAYDFDKMGWNALYSGRNSEALKAFQRGLELNPEYKNLLLNLPLGYLFNNQEEKAMALFQEYKNKPWDPSTPLKTYKDAFLNNFHMIEIDSIPHPDFEKMKALLKK